MSYFFYSGYFFPAVFFLWIVHQQFLYPCILILASLVTSSHELVLYHSFSFCYQNPNKSLQKSDGIPLRWVLMQDVCKNCDFFISGCQSNRITR